MGKRYVTDTDTVTWDTTTQGQLKADAHLTANAIHLTIDQLVLPIETALSASPSIQITLANNAMYYLMYDPASNNIQAIQKADNRQAADVIFNTDYERSRIQKRIANGAITIGMEDISDVPIGFYMTIWGNNYSDVDNRGGAQFVFDTRNSSNGGFTIGRYDGNVDNILTIDKDDNVKLRNDVIIIWCDGDPKTTIGSANTAAIKSLDGAFCVTQGATSDPAPVSASYYLGAAYTVATLPSAGDVPYARAMVSDADNPTFGETVFGSSNTVAPVYSDGTNWRVG